VGGQVRRAAARSGLCRHPAAGQQAAADPEGCATTAAEHFAFADEAHNGPRWISHIARTIVNNPFWDFWWD